jgi:aminoglycoside phosphotransferase (APT) family kinase protein
MELSELEQRLTKFCAAKYDGPSRVHDVVTMPGHAGFAYGFRVEAGARVDAWFIRLPPPNVNWVGTADVLRQVEVLRALEGTEVPHCPVQWSGADLQWFGCPYFIVPWLEGDVMRIGAEDWGAALSPDQHLEFGRQAMTALARVHKVDIAKTPYLGEPVPFAEDVTRWDRFYAKAADPEKLAKVPEARQRLLDTIPHDAPVGIFHGDFQTANLFASAEAELLAIIDWELTGVGATLNDVGWICTFSDRQAWATDTERAMFLDPDTLIELYQDAYGSPVADVNWFRALAAYKFAIISGLNLSLHRRGKRPDETWEVTALSMAPLIDRALDLLA